jgi:hypothetical protein
MDEAFLVTNSPRDVSSSLARLVAVNIFDMAGSICRIDGGRESFDVATSECRVEIAASLKW